MASCLSLPIPGCLNCRRVWCRSGLDLFIDAVFICDIPLNFITTVVSDDGVLIDELKPIATLYFKGAFFLCRFARAQSRLPVCNDKLA